MVPEWKHLKIKVSEQTSNMVSEYYEPRYTATFMLWNWETLRFLIWIKIIFLHKRSKKLETNHVRADITVLHVPGFGPIFTHETLTGQVEFSFFQFSQVSWASFFLEVFKGQNYQILSQTSQYEIIDPDLAKISKMSLGLCKNLK